MAKKAKSLKQLLAQYRKDPTSLTPAELRQLRSAALLAAEAKGGKGYEAIKARARRRARRLSEEGRDIGKPPPVKNPDRRAEACASFRRYCEIYQPNVYHLAWSPDHLAVIERIENIVLEGGGLFALAMERGGGKTNLCESGASWAVLRGSRRFPALIGTDLTAAREMLQSIQTEWETNDLLLADFPEVMYPIRCLERTANRCKGQRCQGVHTRIEWTQDHVVLPTLPAEVLAEIGVPEENGCGAIIKVAGILGRVRGMKHKTPEGESIRPDIVIVDDPQTDATASSPTECRKRVRVLGGAILRLAGPDTRICGFMPCTVIRPGDMADEILDRERHPEWHGLRFKALVQWPKNEELWEKYADIRRAPDLPESRCNTFYRKHRKAMNEGAVVAWPHRKEGCITAIQRLMNIFIDSPDTFFAECQNEPLPEDEGLEATLTADEIMAKINRRPRGQVPAGCETLSLYIDCGQKVLFWCAAAWEPDFTGYVIDYGSYPDQRRAHWTTRNCNRTLGRAHQGMGVEGALYAGLSALTDRLIPREWKREDGALMLADVCFIDQGWKTDTVHQFCRESAHAHSLMPARGAGITASQKPISEYRRGRGDRIGHNWWVPSVRGKRVLRHVEIDTNYWKTFVQDRLATALGDKGCLSLFGDRPDRHRLFAEHVTSEVRVRTEGRGRTVDEWKLPPSKPDNHWLDCLVGCAAAASYEGVELPTALGGRRRSDDRQPIKLSDLQKKRRSA